MQQWLYTYLHLHMQSQTVSTALRSSWWPWPWWPWCSPSSSPTWKWTDLPPPESSWCSCEYVQIWITSPPVSKRKPGQNTCDIHEVCKQTSSNSAQKTSSQNWTGRQRHMYKRTDIETQSLQSNSFLHSIWGVMTYVMLQLPSRSLRFTVIPSKPFCQRPIPIHVNWAKSRCNLIWEFSSVKKSFSYSSQVFLKLKQDMCLWNMDAPGYNKVKIWQKSLSPTIWPRPTPRGIWCQWSVRNL